MKAFFLPLFTVLVFFTSFSADTLVAEDAKSVSLKGQSFSVRIDNDASKQDAIKFIDDTNIEMAELKKRGVEKMEVNVNNMGLFIQLKTGVGKNPAFAAMISKKDNQVVNGSVVYKDTSKQSFTFKGPNTK